MSFCVFATGEYTCKLTLDIFEYASRRKVEVIPIQILASEATEVMCDNSPVSLSCCSEANVNWSQIEWKQEGSISIPGEPVKNPLTNRFFAFGPSKNGDAVGKRASVGSWFFLDLRLWKKSTRFDASSS